MSHSTIVVGVDPDSKAHGVAVYRSGVLSELTSMDLMDVMTFISSEESGRTSIVFSIEDVMRNKFIYGRNQRSNRKVQDKIAISVGRCQQSQVELVRLLETLNIKYELHRPTINNWANNKSMFEKATGWTKRSNEDTRSAAYFGYLALKGG